MYQETFILNQSMVFLRLHNKHVILTPKFFDIDKKLNDYINEHNK